MTTIWELFSVPLSRAEADALAMYADDRLAYSDLSMRVRILVEALNTVFHGKDMEG